MTERTLPIHIPPTSSGGAAATNNDAAPDRQRISESCRVALGFGDSLKRVQTRAALTDDCAAAAAAAAII